MNDIKEEWKQIGEDVTSTVQAAVATGNYAQLSRDISMLMNRAVDAAGRTISVATMQPGSQGSMAGSMNQSGAAGYRNATTSRDGYTDTRTAQYIHEMNRQRYEQQMGGPYPQGAANPYPTQSVVVRSNGARQGVAIPVRQQSPLYATLTGEKIVAALGMVTGYSVGAILAVLTAALAAAGEASIAIFFGVITLLAFLGGYKGNSRFLQIGRFEKYKNLLQGRTYGSISQMATAMGRDVKRTVKDLLRMIGLGWFRQGHIDDEQTTLITSDETYRQYRATQQAALEQRQAEEAEEARREQEESIYTPAQREILQQCEDYIREIRRCNDRIPGERISQKLYRLEHSTRVIMERAKAEPSLTGELRRLVNYYLPTTVKLLDAYADLDQQEKSSSNIEKSKIEIEEAIDAMNDGFDKLYDSLFETTNLDISTDVEVMRTLLEQEGLTGHSFTSDAVMPGTGDEG